MKQMRVAINGFGRMGRIFTRQSWDDPKFDVVAINSRSSADIYAHLLKYDSVYGVWNKDVKADGANAISVDGKKIPLHHEDELVNAPWGKYDVDVVLESTGVFRDRKSSEKHLEAGAKYVLISAPAKDEDKTLIYAINHKEFDPKRHKILSSASCTTTCLAPVVKVLHDTFGIKHGFMVTTHAYTNDQTLVDHPHKKGDFRRSRAAAISVIPTDTGAAKTIIKFVPELKGKLDGMSLRVPIETVSVVNFTCEVKKKTTAEEVNKALKIASKTKYKKLLDVTDLPLVSNDYKGNSFGSTVDAPNTIVLDGTQVSVMAWYDNEWGYVSQMTNLLEYISGKI
ncbi:MAG: type I glyceraldehyde-3-phosphate dehydrogenase [bacterium]|nr:type I glyceraldehyde-3-phosphate dehydrogenase [bacterium]